MAAAVTVADSVVVSAVLFQFAVVVVVLYFVADVEMTVAVSAAEMFVIGVLVVHDVAVVVAGLQAHLITFVRGRCFAVD